MDKRPRGSFLSFDFGKSVQINHIAILPDGQVLVGNHEGFIKPQEISFDRRYMRQSGKHKVINRINGESRIYDPNIKLCNYDICLAVDTNTKLIDGHKFSFTGIAKGKYFLDHPYVKGKVAEEAGFIYRNLDNFQEKYGWYRAIKFLTMSPGYRKEMRVCIIVDAYMEELALINSRRAPIICEYYLPDNFELIYASADVGKEYLSNKLISIADNMANDLSTHFLGLTEDARDKNLMVDENGIQFQYWWKAKLKVRQSNATLKNIRYE